MGRYLSDAMAPLESTGNTQLQTERKPEQLLYGGLNDNERYAMCVVNRYLEECREKALHRSSTDPIPIEEALTWTSLYYRKHKLEVYCGGGDSPDHVDWFRVVCCLLDERRLKRARELHEQLKPAVHGTSESSCARGSDDNTCGNEPGVVLHTSVKKRLKLDKVPHYASPTSCNTFSCTSYTTLPNDIQTAAPGVASDTRELCSPLNKHYIKPSVHWSRSVGVSLNVKGAPPSCNKAFNTSGELQRNAYHRHGEIDFLISILHRWGIVILDCVVKQTFENKGTCDEHFSPRSLTCGQLASLYRRFLCIMAWAFDLRHVPEHFISFKHPKTSDKYLYDQEAILSIDMYRHQMRGLASLIVHVFFPTHSSLIHCTRDPKDGLDAVNNIRKIQNCCKDLPQTYPNSSTPSSDQHHAIWKLCSDSLMYDNDASSECSVPLCTAGWTNPRFVSSTLEHHSQFDLDHHPFSFDMLKDSLSTHFSSDLPPSSNNKKWTYNVEYRLNPQLEHHIVNHDNFKLLVFLLGIISIVWDVFVEFWNRLKHISNCLFHPTTADILQEIRLMSLSIVLSKSKPNELPNTAYYSKLFDQLEILLTNECLPLDMISIAEKAWKIVERAQRDWHRIQKDNDAKKKTLEEEERVQREAAMAENEKREQQRRAAVHYVKLGMAKEAHYNVSNPFWLIGVPPKLATPLLLSKIKRKLSLLLHPDKCLDSALKPDAQMAFTMVTNAIDKAIDLCAKGMHILCSPPELRPPFADDVGIPSFSFSVAKTTPSPSPRNENTQSTQHNGNSRCSTPSENPLSKDSAKIEVWGPEDFPLLIDPQNANKAWTTFSSSVEKKRPEPPQFVTHTATKGNIWVSIPKENGLYARIFISRPWRQPQPDDALVESHRAEDGITFLLPHELAEAIKGCSRASQRHLHYLSAFSCVLFLRAPSLNITEWMTTHRDHVQPVLDSKRKSYSLYVATQTVDIVNNTTSEAVWTTAPVRRFTMPSTKPKVIKSIQLFNNAPPGYDIFRVLKDFCDTPNQPYTDHFPLVKEMNGWTYSTLCIVLNALMENAVSTSHPFTV